MWRRDAGNYVDSVSTPAKLPCRRVVEGNNNLIGYIFFTSSTLSKSTIQIEHLLTKLLNRV
jgi:hypothetical protein